MNEKKKTSSKITVTEEKLRLTLKEYKEANSEKTKLFTYLGFIISLAISLATSEFKSVLGISKELIESLFIVAMVLFIILFLITSLRLIKNHINDEWFIYKIRDLSPPKKEKKTFEFYPLPIIGKILQTLVYLSPLLLWILVNSLIGWNIAWGTSINENGDISYTWGITLFFSVLWFFFAYPIIIMCKDDINNWFDQTFE